MSRPEIKAALKRLDVAWLKRVLTRAEQVRADQAHETTLARSQAATQDRALREGQAMSDRSSHERQYGARDANGR